MRAKSFALLILALGCGLIASIGITQVLAKKDTGPAPASTDMVDVFVALQDIDRNEPLTPQALKLESWPKDKVPAGALTKIEDIEGRKTRIEVPAGYAILENLLYPVGKEGSGVSELIPRGYRVIPVKVDSVSGGSGMIRPGDRVDVTVYVKRNPASGIKETGIRDVLQDVKVFAVGSKVEIETDETGKQMTAKTISLLVTPIQAKELMLATELGSVRLMMRGATGEDNYEPGMVSSGQYFGGATDDEGDSQTAGQGTPQGSGGGFLDILENKARETAAAVGMGSDQASKDRRTMRIVRGDVIEHVTMEKEGQPADGGIEQWRVTDSEVTGNLASLAPEPPKPVIPELPTEPDTEEPQADAPQIEPNTVGN